MRGSGAAGPKVLCRFHDPLPENLLPEAVHRNSRDQGILFAHKPARQLESVAWRGFARYFEKSRRISFDKLSLTQVAAPDPKMSGSFRSVLALLHNQRGNDWQLRKAGRKLRDTVPCRLKERRN